MVEHHQNHVLLLTIMLLSSAAAAARVHTQQLQLQQRQPQQHQPQHRQAAADKPAPTPPPPPPPAPPAAPMLAGYIPLPTKPGSSLWYAYYSPRNTTAPADAPVLLWLQGGPGCASSGYGLFYEVGPYLVAEKEAAAAAAADGTGTGRHKGGGVQLRRNRWSWNEQYGLLIIDQPVGVGFSIAADKAHIPQDMEETAADLYAALWAVFDRHQELQRRPLVITGESFAGRYIPSVAHYILQLEEAHAAAQQPTSSNTNSNSLQQYHHQQRACRRTRRQQQQQPSGGACWAPRHRHSKPLDLASVPPPNFALIGAAIGNGLTDPVPQTRALASVFYNRGLVSEVVQEQISVKSEEVVQLVAASEWHQATAKRSALLAYIQQTAGLATLLDVRRAADYDSTKAVQRLLNTPEMRAVMHASPEAGPWASCSSEVEAVLADDVMRSARVLVEDLLQVLPVLLYQGADDGQDGPAGTNAWLKGLDGFAELRAFEAQVPQLWYADSADGDGSRQAAQEQQPAGWRRAAGLLTQVVVRNAGHMVPHDQPRAAQTMLQAWVQGVLQDEMPGVLAVS